MPYDFLPDGLHLDEPIRACVDANMASDGSYGISWLVITETNLYVFVRDGDKIVERLRLPLSEISDPKVVNLVGGGTVEVTHNGLPLEVARFSTSCAGRIAAIVHLLEKWLKGEDAEKPDEEMTRCPQCGLPLEAGTKVCPACAPKGRALKRLLGYLRPYWGAAITLSLLTAASTLLGFVPALLQRPLMDNVLVPKGPHPLTVPERLHMLGLLVLALLATHVGLSVLSMAQGWISGRLGNRLMHDIRCQLYEQLQYLSLRFFDKRQMGSVISRVNQDTGQLHQFLVWASQDLAINFLRVIGIGTVLCVINWKLALLVLAPTPIMFLVSTTFWRHIRPTIRRFFHRWGKVNAVLTETLNGLRIVKAFAQESREISRFRRQSDELALFGMRIEQMWALAFTAFTLPILLGTLLIWYFGGRQVLLGGMSLGTLMVFITMVGMFFQPIQALSHLLNLVSRSLTAAERIFEVLDSQPEVLETDKAITMPQIAGRVEFRDVVFGYERHRLALKGVSFDVAAGEMIGLVGHSGAGKTTTINLMCRFYDVLEGEILIDGVPIRDIRLEDLRRQIGLVPQDCFLFSGTIAENIAYARPEATLEDIMRAAKVANAHDFILQKPDGYETQVGEGGQGLSGGEKQRIAIARAVLHDPRILILDEATSHVDVETEKQIQEAIGRLVQGRTTFAIAHRLATLKNADRLLVLKEGKVAEIGTHDELLANEDGEFHRQVQAYTEVSRIQAVVR